MSFLIDSNESSTGLYCDIVDRRYFVFMNFSREKERSPLATVTGIVKIQIYAKRLKHLVGTCSTLLRT